MGWPEPWSEKENPLKDEVWPAKKENFWKEEVQAPLKFRYWQLSVGWTVGVRWTDNCQYLKSKSGPDLDLGTVLLPFWAGPPPRKDSPFLTVVHAIQSLCSSAPPNLVRFSLHYLLPGFRTLCHINEASKFGFSRQKRRRSFAAAFISYDLFTMSTKNMCSLA